MYLGLARQKPAAQPDGTITPNRAMRRDKSPLHGKKRFVLSIRPLQFVDVACTKRRPRTVTAERRAANRRARVARRVNR